MKSNTDLPCFSTVLWRLEVSSRNSLSPRIAFTLLELLAVLTVLAIIAAIALPRLGSSHRLMATEVAVSNLIRLDRHARGLAIASETPIILRLDIDANRLWCEMAGDNERGSVTLPKSAGIISVISTRERKKNGVVMVRYASLGSSETFAVELGSVGNANKWLLFCGLSGQVQQFASQRDVERIFEQLK